MTRQKLRIAVIAACLVIGYYGILMLRNNAMTRHSDEINTASKSEDQSSSEKSGMMPRTFLSVIELSNQTSIFENDLRNKYGPPSYLGVHKIDTTLTVIEMTRYRACVSNGPRDRSNNGSTFWGKASHIRKTHHTYLSNENAVLMEIGGNQGDDAIQFVKLYNPRYIILEPLEEYAKLLQEKFKNNSKVTVVNLGLGHANEVAYVKVEGNNAEATSKFSGTGGNVSIYIAEAVEFLQKIGVGLFDIDLLTMNCEGCEYEALESILSTSIVNNLRNIQFATHSTIPGLKDPIDRYCRIQELLNRTHRPTYQYRFIWESWRRRDL